MTIKISATIITGNLRDVENCDSDAAIDSIMAAAEKAGEEFAEKHNIIVTVERYISDHERQSRTIHLWSESDDPQSESVEAARLEGELTEHLDEAIGRAIEDGDWLDEPAALKLFNIFNRRTSFHLGEYPGNTPEEALDAMARDAGYRDYAHAQEVAYCDPADMIVTEV